jgi:hypothetical protein
VRSSIKRAQPRDQGAGSYELSTPAPLSVDPDAVTETHPQKRLLPREEAIVLLNLLNEATEGKIFINTGRIVSVREAIRLRSELQSD